MEGTIILCTRSSLLFNVDRNRPTPTEFVTGNGRLTRVRIERLPGLKVKKSEMRTDLTVCTSDKANTKSKERSETLIMNDASDECKGPMDRLIVDQLTIFVPFLPSTSGPNASSTGSFEKKNFCFTTKENV